MNSNQTYKIYVPQIFVAIHENDYIDVPSVEPTEYIYTEYPSTNIPIVSYTPITPDTIYDKDVSYITIGIGTWIFIVLFIYVYKIYEINRKKIRKIQKIRKNRIVDIENRHTEYNEIF